MIHFLLLYISLNLIFPGYATTIAYTNENETLSQFLANHLKLYSIRYPIIRSYEPPSMLRCEEATGCVCDNGYLQLSLSEGCHLPYREGPCASGSYLYLAINETESRCVVNPCIEDGLVPYNGSCHRIGLWEEGSCDIGALVADPDTFQLKCINEVANPLRISSQLRCTGDRYLNTFNSQDPRSWKCQCRRFEPKYFPLKNGCYRPYRQGPCQTGSYLYAAINETEPRCVVNHCLKDGLVPHNGICYTIVDWDDSPCEIGVLPINPSLSEFRCMNDEKMTTTSTSFLDLIRCPKTMYESGYSEDQRLWRCRCENRNHLYIPSYNSCHEVYKRGPCPPGQYVRLAINETIGKCVVNPCPEDYMILHNGTCYKIGVWEEGPCGVGGLLIDRDTFQAKCVDETTDLLSLAHEMTCSGGRSFNTFFSADMSIWKCDCDEPGHFYFPSKNGCYQLYRQGPCPLGQYVYLANNETEPQCVVNPCSDDGLVPYNGTCHKYAQWGEGPCNIGGLVADPTTHQLKCIEEITSPSLVKDLMECPHDLVLLDTWMDDINAWNCGCRSYDKLFFPINNVCVDVYRQGPCSPGYYVYRAINETLPQCVVNPCNEDGMVPYNGTCYKYGPVEGSCGEDRFFRLDYSTFQLICEKFSTSTLVIGNLPGLQCASNTQRDQHGACREIVSD